MGKRIDVPLYRPPNFLGQFENEIVFPNVCVKCLGPATEKYLMTSAFEDKKGNIEINFPYCTQCINKVSKSIIPIIIFGSIGIICFAIWFLNAFFYIFANFLILPKITFWGWIIAIPLLFISLIYQRIVSAMDIHLIPNNSKYEYINFTFNNIEYGQKFIESNKKFFTNEKIKDISMLFYCIERLKSSDPTARKQSAKMLGDMGNVRAIEPLTGLINDKNKHVREAVKEALDKIKSAQKERK